LTYLFNSCMKLFYFPKVKPGKDHSNPSNYRLLSSISKVFEKIILKRLQDFISANNILPDHRFGFRMAHSTSHQLKRVACYFLISKKLSTRFGMRFFFINFLRGAVTSLWLIFYFLKERSFQLVLVKHSLRPAMFPMVC
jgi:hypothetical protein